MYVVEASKGVWGEIERSLIQSVVFKPPDHKIQLWKECFGAFEDGWMYVSAQYNYSTIYLAIILTTKTLTFLGICNFL